MRLGFVTAFLAATVAYPVFAQEREQALFEALGLPETIQIMQQEGQIYAASIADDLFPGRGEGRWSARVGEIYDLENMEAEVSRRFERALEGTDRDAMLAFFASERGQRIVSLEVSARQALLDEELEAMSKEMATEITAQNGPRYQQVVEFVTVNDMVEANVMGALNASYAFYHGMVDGGGFPYELTEDQILNDVWSQEPEIRSSTTEWVYSYLLMAYQPLSDEDMQAYIEFSQTTAGRELNDALFDAFDQVFVDISSALGTEAGRMLMEQEL